MYLNKVLKTTDAPAQGLTLTWDVFKFEYNNRSLEYVNV